MLHAILGGFIINIPEQLEVEDEEEEEDEGEGEEYEEGEGDWEGVENEGEEDGEAKDRVMMKKKLEIKEILKIKMNM